MQRITEVRRIKDGAIKRVLTGVAIRLVSKEGYEYVHEGVEEDTINAQKRIEALRNTTVSKVASRTNADVLTPRNLNVVDAEPAPELQHKARGQRVLKKNIDISPETLQRAKALNAIPAPPAIMTRDSNSLKEIIEKTKQRRKRTER